MKTHSETSVDAEQMQLVLASAEDGVEAVGVASSKEAPLTIVKAVDAYVFAWQQGTLDRKRRMDPEDAPFALGALWGQQVVRALGWHWATITFHEHGNSHAMGVISEDRSLAIFPIHFIMGAMQNRSVDVTIELSFNMLKAGKIPNGKPGDLFNVMAGVGRIVPRV